MWALQTINVVILVLRYHKYSCIFGIKRWKKNLHNKILNRIKTIGRKVWKSFKPTKKRTYLYNFGNQYYLLSNEHFLPTSKQYYSVYIMQDISILVLWHSSLSSFHFVFHIFSLIFFHTYVAANIHHGFYKDHNLP